LQSQRQLGEPQKFDALLAEFTESKKDNPDFMAAAGQAYLNTHGSFGQIIDGGFQRGMNGQGEYIQVTEQDRLRALQCLLHAHRTVEKGGAKEVEFLRQIGNALTLARTGSGNVWRLHLLTDLAATPDYTERIDTITSEGAPAGEDGNPVWLNVPESWETAVSDGERWRWTMGEIARIDPNQTAAEGLKWFGFCQSHYDVNTLATYGWWSQPAVKERDGILQASTLKESETIARLANGVKRFTLREDYQFIPGLRTIMRMGKDAYSAQAGDQLVQIFLNRRQYVQAAETLKEVIGLHGKGVQDQREKLRQQILGNWSRFGITPTYHAANPVEVPYVFRNAKEVSLKLSAVKDELVMAEGKSHRGRLREDPIRIDRQPTDRQRARSLRG
jgi:hypothetical protein